jgi:uncharacterized protein YdeI (YjbR/CyaY-like superfamily)
MLEDVPCLLCLGFFVFVGIGATMGRNFDHCVNIRRAREDADRPAICPAMTEQNEIARVEISSEQELWDWLEANHAGPSVWLVTWKATHRERYVGRDAVLDALIAYGWVDGRRMKLDDDRTMQLISPRKAQVWARSYKARADKLLADGRMRPPGLAALEAARSSGRWTEADPVDDLVVPGDLRDRLDALDASGWFDAAAPSYRRNVLRYLAAAKRAETRDKRIRAIAEHAARGEKLAQY